MRGWQPLNDAAEKDDAWHQQMLLLAQQKLQQVIPATHSYLIALKPSWQAEAEEAQYLAEEAQPHSSEHGGSELQTAGALYPSASD